MTTRPSFSVLGSTVYACQEIVNYLKTKLEGGIEEIDKVQVVERHIGRFDKPQDVKHWMSKRDGGVRIAALKVLGYENIGGRLIGNVSFVAYVFAADQYGYEKDTRAEVIAGKLVKAMFGRSAPTTAYEKAQGFRADNMYSVALDELGMALWAVTWQQKWYLDEPIDETTLDDFITFGLKGELEDGAPTIEGEVELPQ